LIFFNITNNLMLQTVQYSSIQLSAISWDH